MRATDMTAEDLEPIDMGPDERAMLAAGVRRTVTLAFYETQVAVGFDDELAAAGFARRYARFAADGRTKATLRAYVVRDRDDVRFWFDDAAAYRWPLAASSATIEFLADSLVRHEYFAHRSNALAFHAAAVAVGDHAVAIAASSHGGKTTTALACARRGLGFYGDEQCVVAEGGWVRAFPRAINIRRGSAALIAADLDFRDGGLRARLAARAQTGWPCAAVEDVLGTAALPLPHPLAAVYFITGRAAEPDIAELPLARALPLFFAAYPRSRANGIDRVARAVAMFGAGKPYALTLGTPDATARAIAAHAL